MKDERQEFEIKIDGEDYTLTQKEMTVGEVLSLAGKSQEAFHLVELRGQQRQEYMAATDEVKLHNGSEFITKHVGPTTVS